MTSEQVREIVWRIEEEFSVGLSMDSVSKLRTAGEFRDYVIEKLINRPDFTGVADKYREIGDYGLIRSDSNPDVSSWDHRYLRKLTYLRLRKAFAELFDIPREQLTPDAVVYRLIPRENR